MRRLILTTVTAGLLLVFSSSGYTQSFTIHQLTNNDVANRFPSVYNGTIAWAGAGDDGVGLDIFYWDGSDVNQVSNDNKSTEPSLYNGTIAWQGHDGNDWEIFYWDGTNTTQVTNNNFRQDVPAPFHDEHPSLYNSNIVWSGLESSEYQIFHWDGNEVTHVTNDTTSQRWPSLYNGTIAWADSKDNWDIYYWDGANTTQITRTPSHKDHYPSLYNGTIAWNELRDTESKVLYWNGGDLADGSNITQVTADNSTRDLFPSLYDGTIAWQGWDGNDWEIFYWDGSDVTQITNNDVADESPSLYDGTIAWQGWDGNEFEIFYATVASEPLSIITQNLPDGLVGKFYSETLQATGGTPPYIVWNITAGSLPNGLGLVLSSGVIFGTPIDDGIFNFTVEVFDNGQQTATQNLSIVVSLPVELNTKGKSHLHWPFTESSWADRNGWRPTQGQNKGFHHLGDFYAQDWANKGDDTTCGQQFNSPIPGTVIFSDNLPPAGKNYGNQVVIQSSDDPNFAFRVAHLDMISVSLGQLVSIGTKLGEVGGTGGVVGSKKNPRGCHAHCVLYQNINSIFSETETGLQRLQSGLDLGFSEEKNKKNDFAANFSFNVAEVDSPPAAPTVAIEAPKEIQTLLPFPVPANPETWIPYRLNSDSEVAIHIYDARGHLVRELNLGHQAIGLYNSKSKAAYWDGRNTQGERVPSGIYFYHLQAGDYHATRKILILK